MFSLFAVSVTCFYPPALLTHQLSFRLQVTTSCQTATSCEPVSTKPQHELITNPEIFEETFRQLLASKSSTLIQEGTSWNCSSNGSKAGVYERKRFPLSAQTEADKSVFSFRGDESGRDVGRDEYEDIGMIMIWDFDT